MSYKKYLNKVQNIFENYFNDFLASKNLDKIELFATSQYELGQHNNSLAIYSDSPSGEVYKENGDYAEASVTIAFYMNDLMSPQEDAKCIDYFDAFLEFIHKNRFGEFDLIQTSFPILISAGYDYNGVAILLNSRIETFNDYF